MNPALTTLLAAAGVALCALLIVASGLIRTSLKRRKAIAAGGPDYPSRILDDLRPVETLLVDFVSHTRQLATVLAILSSFDAPASFARLVHEIRIGRDGLTDLRFATNLVAPALAILGLAGLVRVTTGGFVITEAGREVLRRIDCASQPVGRSAQAVLVERKAQLAAAGRKERNQLANKTVVIKEASIMNRNNRNIVMTAADDAELEAVIMFTGKVSERARVELSALEGELKRAEIVDPGEIPSDAITMNSRAELLDLESKERMPFTLVLPRDAKIDEGNISLLAPLGTCDVGVSCRR